MNKAQPPSHTIKTQGLLHITFIVCCIWVVEIVYAGDVHCKEGFP